MSLRQERLMKLCKKCKDEIDLDIRLLTPEEIIELRDRRLVDITRIRNEETVKETETKEKEKKYWGKEQGIEKIDVEEEDDLTPEEEAEEEKEV